MATSAIAPDQELVNALAQVRRAGSFAGSGVLEPLDPQIHVPSLGKITVPLQNNQTKELFKLCHQAPFGKGSETIVDLAVRNTQELNVEQSKSKIQHGKITLQKQSKKRRKPWVYQA